PAQPTVETKHGGNRRRDLPAGRGEWVLLIEDETAVRQVTRAMLEAAGYHVLLARDGAEGVRMYTQHQEQVRVVITDMMMPVLDGAATISVLRQINPRVLIIAA